MDKFWLDKNLVFINNNIECFFNNLKFVKFRISILYWVISNLIDYV